MCHIKDPELRHAERVEGKDKAALQTGCDLQLARVDAGLAHQATVTVTPCKGHPLLLCLGLRLEPGLAPRSLV